MKTSRLKPVERRNNWRCCFCCHVRTGTIFIGVWNLLIHLTALSVMTIIMSYPEQTLDPVLPTPLSEVDNINFSMSESSLDVTVNDGPLIKAQPLLPRSYRDLWEHKNLTSKDMNIGIVVTFCTFAMTLLLLYGAVKGKPSYLMPFFCLQVFDFCIASISAVGYLCYPPEINRTFLEGNHIPMKEMFLKFKPQTLGFIAAIVFLLVMLIKAYFIGVVWSCYKYLTLRLVASQRTIQFIDPDVQTLLTDLPDYDTAIKKFPTPPPSYASAILGKYPLVVDMNNGTSTTPRPVMPQNIISPETVPADAAAASVPPPPINSEKSEGAGVSNLRQV